MGERSLEYRADVDGLRAVAVLLVVAYHAFPEVIHGGFIGVDVFFVISGFLISTIILKALDDGTFGYGWFYARRIRRIFPALMLVFAACLAFGWFWLIPTEYMELGKHASAGTLFVSNLVFWHEAGYFDHNSQTKTFLHLWSLGIEEQFYLVWPLGLVWLRKRPWGVLGIVGVSFLVNLWLVKTSPEAAFYAPFSRFWELALGASLAQLTLAKPQVGLLGKAQALLHASPASLPLRNALSLGGLLLIVGTALVIDSEQPFPGWWATLPVAGSLLIIVAGRLALLNLRLLSSPPMVLIGLISYPLYLWHWPILVGLRQLDLHWLPPMSRLVRMGAVAVSFGLAYLTYRALELRVRHALNAVPALCASAVVVLAASFSVAWGGGAPGRFSAEQNRIAAVAAESLATSPQDYRTARCFLEPGQSERDFQPECEEASGKSEDAIVLWGDSHAAHLYYALHAVARENGLTLAQFTASRCPPLVGRLLPHTHAHCANINAHVLERISFHRPRTVVLAANWPLYDLETLQVTLERLRALSIEQVVVVGPVAMFSSAQSNLLFRSSSVGKVTRTLGESAHAPAEKYRRTAPQAKYRPRLRVRVAARKNLQRARVHRRHRGSP